MRLTAQIRSRISVACHGDCFLFTSVLYFNERQRGRVSVQPLSQFLLGSPRPLDDSSAPNMSESAEVSAAASRVLVRFNSKKSNLLSVWTSTVLVTGAARSSLEFLKEKLTFTAPRLSSLKTPLKVM